MRAILNIGACGRETIYKARSAEITLKGFTRNQKSSSGDFASPQVCYLNSLMQFWKLEKLPL